jgi:glycyl-radical enzyme activating protein
MSDHDTKGMVISILRFALQDGPGIRTTVFLKGCPLDCLWCHNPESKSGKKELAYYADRCTQCGACVDACPNDAHSISDGTHHLDRARCDLAGACVEACSYEALEITGEMMTAAEVMEVVMKDKAYYDESGGGLSLSGGEPMMQFEFTRELLIRAKKNQLHTCLDTSGHATEKQFLEIAPYVDLFLFDLKASDSLIHKELTGVSNILIMNNFKFLYERGAQIEVRIPLVQDVNDQPLHLEYLSKMKQKYPKLEGLTLMPYHNIGKSKCERYGYTDALKGKPTANEELIVKWHRELGN